MYLLENPVLQRELLVNLRMSRGFGLLLGYVGLLGGLVYYAWPQQQTLDLTTTPEEARRLVNLFLLGQFVLISLMAPSFAAGSITGEKERKTYEMLLASPMRPGAIVLGKLLASLVHLAALVVATLPIVMLCLLLGGVHVAELSATYVGMGAAVVTFGMISLACSSYFGRTAAALVVSYSFILPLVLVAVVFYQSVSALPRLRLTALALGAPSAAAGLCGVLLVAISRRLMHPPDVGAEAEEVVDLEEEQRDAVGMVIRHDQFPDSLFAPPKRTDLMADQANPVYDKEMRSEIFGRGTLMLRLVIQMSMALALVVMAVCLYVYPHRAAWYTSYVILFNMLVGPVFAAGSVTNERERQTLELLLTTLLSPWQILAGKLAASLRISAVLTGFLVWPILLAWLLPPWKLWQDTVAIVGYLAILIVTCLTTTTLAMFTSVLCRKTSTSMISAYGLVCLLFIGPVAARLFGELTSASPEVMQWIDRALVSSPFAATHSLPVGASDDPSSAPVRWGPGFAAPGFLAFALALDVVLWGTILWLFRLRWRATR